jgi:hypothetical protein
VVRGDHHEATRLRRMVGSSNPRASTWAPVEDDLFKDGAYPRIYYAASGPAGHLYMLRDGTSRIGGCGWKAERAGGLAGHAGGGQSMRDEGDGEWRGFAKDG